MNIGCYRKTFRADQMLFSGIRRLLRIIVLRKEIGWFSLECWTRFFSDLDVDFNGFQMDADWFFGFGTVGFSSDLEWFFTDIGWTWMVSE